MSPVITIVLIIVVLVVIAAIVYGVQAGRRKKLQSTFGPEYDRVVADTGNRTEAEKELREREKRHAELELKELSPESQQRYRAAWEEVQIQFVDNPSEAVGTADELVTRLIAERGYPTGEYDERLANLSVEHANTLQHYRDAHEISERNTAGSATTEDLRQALVHYRALFADLLGTDPVSVPPSTTAGTTTSSPDDETISRSDESTSRSDEPISRADEPASRADEPASRSEDELRSRSDDEPAPAPRRAADTDAATDNRR
jgi:hypothetical protein